MSSPLANFVHLFRHAEAAEGLYHVRKVTRGSRGVGEEEVPSGSLAFNAAYSSLTPATRRSTLMGSEADVEAPQDAHLRPTNTIRAMGTSHWDPSLEDETIRLHPQGDVRGPPSALNSAASAMAAMPGVGAGGGSSPPRRASPSRSGRASRQSPQRGGAGAGDNADGEGPRGEKDIAALLLGMADEVRRSKGKPARSPLRRRREVPPRLDPLPLLPAGKSGETATAGLALSAGPASPAGSGGMRSAGGSASVGGSASASTNAAVPKRVAITVRTSLKDHAVLADSSLRAGLSGNEAKSYFSQGILYDNEAQYEKALECYRKYLAACHRAGDVLGEALAYNHMGVDYQVLGGENYKLALLCHAKHAEIADEAGQFIAQHNMGLCYTALGQDDLAIQHYERALELATSLRDPSGEAMAAGQLGAALGRLSSPEEGVRFIQRRVELADALGDVHEKATAYSQLGDLFAAISDVESAIRYYAGAADLLADADRQAAAKTYADLGQYVNDQGMYDEAQHYYETAMQLAIRVDDPELVARARCGVGIALGNAVLGDHLEQVKRVIVDTTPLLHIQQGP
ncbi:uncharacterized protein AMSG_10340 [Thecamonas trahens ATCC 50062]|uniref:Uncharacterized protein n=1 Tax=Thecamonas trahens ATCC 50062 TaxID=461836 RepID=A0A0L0DPX2_THETB|nr:hypothetical protein AMSG_10340 [Thecamonas trahens ATCC 50062]KNC54347.1 hypothetical protein AMSG_10340 [Thecamonas trahens ATCC 50062]|eukprot:XP_013753803.1 hypothetical protein AMSG_10340 [Thecamonas trahens ATCC 50062]